MPYATHCKIESIIEFAPGNFFSQLFLVVSDDLPSFSGFGIFYSIGLSRNEINETTCQDRTDSVLKRVGALFLDLPIRHDW